MTPEERARPIVDWLMSDALIDGEDVQDRIVVAIRAAVEAERERCAEIADRYTVDYSGFSQTAYDIAAAIRKGE